MLRKQIMMETGGFPTLRNLTQNHLLAALPAEELDRLGPNLRLVAMPLGQVLCESGETLRYACFPTTAIVSLRYVLESGASADMSVIGNEGVFGLPLFMGSQTSPGRAVVQNGGYGFQVDAQWLMEEFIPGGALMRALLRYSQGLLSQTAQIGACDHYHSTDQRLCRWLLMSLDRLSSNELEISSDLIADMTGVQPERFAEAAGKLRDKGLIEYSHSHIVVLDRPGLEKRACECYAVVKGVFDRLLPRKTQSEFA